MRYTFLQSKRIRDGQMERLRRAAELGSRFVNSYRIQGKQLLTAYWVYKVRSSNQFDPVEYYSHESGVVTDPGRATLFRKQHIARYFAEVESKILSSNQFQLAKVLLYTIHKVDFEDDSIITFLSDQPLAQWQRKESNVYFGSLKSARKAVLKMKMEELKKSVESQAALTDFDVRQVQKTLKNHLSRFSNEQRSPSLPSAFSETK